MIKVAFCADTHLRASQDARSSRSMDFHSAFEFVIKDSVKRGADVLLVTGDILDTTRPTSHTMSLLKHLNNTAKKLNLLVLCTSGNHDLSRPHWIDVMDFSEKEDCGFKMLNDEYYTFSKGGEELTIAGMSYCPSNEMREKLPDMGPANILMWHGDVKEFGGFKEDAITSDELTREPFDMVLLGDIHQRQFLTVNGKLIGYPGATELCKSDEPDEHSYELFEITTNPFLASQEQVMIPSRLVIRAKNVQTQAQADELVELIRRDASKNPLVFVEHDSAIKGLRERIVSALPEDAIVSVRRIPKNINMMSALEIDDKGKQPADFVCHFFDAGTTTYATAVELTRSDIHAPDVLERFIEQRTAELTNETARPKETLET